MCSSDLDPDAAEPALLELDHAGVEQLAHRLPALRPQFAILGGRATAERRAGMLLARGAHGTPTLGRPAGRPGALLTDDWLRGTLVCLLRHTQSVVVATTVPAITR